MKLPTFIGIGAQKAGSTWLHELLSSHPEIYMPKKRKEIHYFDWHFHKGLDWYQQFFVEVSQKPYKAIGEISPDYLYEELAPARIQQLLPKAKIIVILRNPTDRAYSHYGMMSVDENLKDSFELCLKKRPELFERGKYGFHLQRYFQLFDARNILVLIFEESVKNVDQTKVAIAQFLNVSPEAFPPNAGTQRIYEAANPKYRRLYALAKWLSFRMHKYDLSDVVRLAKSLGISGLFGKGQARASIQPETRASLMDAYQEDIEYLEQLIGRSLDIWKTPK